MTWMDEVPCRGAVEVFFGPHNERGADHYARLLKARAICAGCHYTHACGELMRGREGFYAGKDHDAQGWPLPFPDGYVRPGRKPRAGVIAAEHLFAERQYGGHMHVNTARGAR